MSRLLLFIVTLAALAVLPARDGAAMATLYREPKAVVLSLGVWIWLAVLLALGGGRGGQTMGVFSRLPRVVSAPPVAIWLLWVLYMAVSSIWGRVAENALYELRTLLPAAFWMVLLIAWQGVESRAADGLRRALIVAAAACLALAAVQLVTPIPWLPPIHAELGGPHASTFGFKNPAALAVLGQFFLLLGWALEQEHAARRWLALALAFAEAIYIASLHSRTALLALFVGLLYLGLAALCRRGRPGRRISKPAAAAALGAVVVLAAAVSLVEPWRERAQSGAEVLLRPATYLESDRGTYLLNTLAMVQEHPAGVGLGDWQTFYPVFRAHDREFAFDHLVEVRRAHSDHVQILGEGGWPGLALWLVALGVTSLGGFNRWRTSGDLRALLCSAQIVAWAVAMATDYVIEMPFHRFQFFLVLALAIGCTLRAGRALELSVDPNKESPNKRRAALVLAAVVGMVALTEAWRGYLLLARLRASAFMTQTYQKALTQGDLPGFRRALHYGEEVARLPGYTKTTPRDERILAHLYWLHDAEQQAFYWLRRSLERQPYAPAGLELASHMLERRWPEAAAEFALAHNHVVAQARRGYDRPYPSWPEMRPENATSPGPGE